MRCYCGMKPPFRDDLWPIIKRHAAVVEATLQGRPGLVQEDCFPHFWRDDVRHCQITIEWGTPLWFADGVYFWHKLIVRGLDARRKLEETLECLGLRAFEDGDAQGNGIFCGEEGWPESHNSRFFAYCYISPDFPEGYSQNHTLEVEPKP